MKGNEKLISSLNSLLADELTAINQYIVHAEMSENWGYHKLHDHFQKRSIEEMKHAEKLIARIIFLEGLPIVSNLKKLRIGADISAQLSNDHASEVEAIQAYNETIKLAYEVGDSATKEVLEHILKDEDRHIDAIEALQDQIKQMSVQVFLSTKV